MPSYGEIHILSRETEGTSNEDKAANRQILRRAQSKDPAARELRQIAERVYTSNMHDDLAAVVRRNIWYILPHLFPGTVVTSRTAAKMRPYEPEKGGRAYVFLSGPYASRNVELPGVEIRLINGPGPLPDDAPMTTRDFFIASQPRVLLENLKPSRMRAGVMRNLRPEELEEHLVVLLDSGGVENFNAIRDRAREISGDLGAEAEFAALDRIMGGLLGTRKTKLASRAGQLRSTGVDPACAERLQALFSHLGSRAFADLAEPADPAVRQTTAFIEAYFSNFIEGTEFLPKEAQRIVYEGAVPENRPADGHDILSTYRMLVDERALRAKPADFDEFERMLRARHALLMEARPEKRPGHFKTSTNKAGNTVFVDPDKVVGTLRYGYDMLQGLKDPFARGIFLHYLIAEVHPFDDGNGRISRLHLSAELSAGKRTHVVVPTVFREDYIGGMRSLSMRGDPAPMARCLVRAQEVTASINQPGPDGAIEEWAKTYAFVKGSNARLEPYDPSVEIEWHKGMPAPKTFWEAELNPVDVFSSSPLSR